MTPKKLILKTAVKIIIFVLAMAIVAAVTQSPVITNEVALGQMQNSNEAYVLMNIWLKIRPMVDVLCTVAAICFVGNIVRDICKFIKTTKNNKEKEKN